MHLSKVVVSWVIRIVIMTPALLSATGWLYQESQLAKREPMKKYTIDQNKIEQGKFTYSYTLENGMTIIVREQHTVPKVSMQIWYNVGSKDEQVGQKGIAHFIEHLIFKGTSDEVGESLNLSESDINVIAHKLSGYINAFTSFDYTGYLFNMPTQHYKEIFSIMADCMQSAKFDDQMINSEMKAVIQELKMRRDNYSLSLIEQLMTVLFQDHPYHYPIIGYKSDLWSVSGKELMSFYKEHYIPNNATLVVAGDVDHNEVFELAQKYFGKISANKAYKKQTFISHPDIVSKSVTLYRDIQQPLVYFTFIVPGLIEKTDINLEILAWVLGEKRSSRLHKILVDELQLVTAVSAWHWDLFDYGLFGIGVYPKNVNDIKKIEQIIIEQITDIAKNGILDWEFNRAVKNAQMDLYGVFEDIQEQATLLGQSYLATGDAEYALRALDDIDAIKKNVLQLVRDHIRPAVMHKGYLYNLPEGETVVWNNLQKKSDKEDKSILSARMRTSEIEPVSHANNINAQDPKSFDYPKPEILQINNGIKILHHAHADLKKVEIRLALKARWFYDPEEKQGLYNFVSDMLLEGTKKYTHDQLAREIESRGIDINSYIGGVSISLLRDDIPFGLEILYELINNALFDEKNIEKVRNQLFVQIKQTWDNPRAFSDKLLYKTMYKNHPYHKDPLGSKESVASITRDDLINFYKKIYSPDGAKIAIVGDIAGLDIVGLCKQYLGSWQGTKVEDIEFPELTTVSNQEILHTINRDQVVLTLAQLSVDFLHPDFEKLLLFDQIFGGGVLGSMASRLFALREATGLFYSIRGSLVAGANEQKGIFKIKTMVSLDRLQEAVDAIKKTIISVLDTITDEELLEAKRAIVNSQVDNFQTGARIAGAFLFLDRYDLPFDYFDKRMKRFENISVDDVKQAVAPHLQTDNLVTFKIGRV